LGACSLTACAVGLVCAVGVKWEG